MSRILFLLTQDLSSPSGLGRYWPIAQELVGLGHAVEINALHANFASLPLTTFEQNGVRIQYIGQMHVFKEGSIKKYFRAGELMRLMWIATWRFAQAALRTNADIIYIGKPHPMNGIAGLLAKWFRRKKMVVDCDDYEIGVNRYQGAWQRVVVQLFENLLPKAADLVTTNTFFTKTRLEDSGIQAQKIIYLPNGLERRRFARPEDSTLQALRQSLGLSHKKIVGFVGTLGKHAHPVDLLIDAFSLVKKTVPDACLLLVGGGEDLEALKAKAAALGIAENVLFVGRVDPQEVNNYYYLMDVSVDPVYDDLAARGRCPLKIFESWGCGISVVAGRVGDREILAGDPPAIYLVKPGDAGALAHAVEHILREPNLSASLREAGWIRVRDYYWDVISRVINQIF